MQNEQRNKNDTLPRVRLPVHVGFLLLLHSTQNAAVGSPCQDWRGKWSVSFPEPRRESHVLFHPPLTTPGAPGGAVVELQSVLCGPAPPEDTRLLPRYPTPSRSCNHCFLNGLRGRGSGPWGPGVGRGRGPHSHRRPCFHIIYRPAVWFWSWLCRVLAV